MVLLRSLESTFKENVFFLQLSNICLFGVCLVFFVFFLIYIHVHTPKKVGFFWLVGWFFCCWFFFVFFFSLYYYYNNYCFLFCQFGTERKCLRSCAGRDAGTLRPAHAPILCQRAATPPPTPDPWRPQFNPLGDPSGATCQPRSLSISYSIAPLPPPNSTQPTSPNVSQRRGQPTGAFWGQILQDLPKGQRHPRSPPRCVLVVRGI